MNRILLITGVSFLLTASVLAAERSVLARVTVYWASGGSGSDRWTRRHQAATDVRLRNGHCAVDPRHIPYGSKVVLPDGTLTAVDTGSHVRTRRAARRAGRSAAERNAIVIDRFFETKRQALNWARKHPHYMTVRVVSPNAQRQSSAFAQTRTAPRAATPRIETRRTNFSPVAPAATTTPAFRLAGNSAPAALPNTRTTIHDPSHHGRAVAYLP